MKALPESTKSTWTGLYIYLHWCEELNTLKELIWKKKINYVISFLYSVEHIKIDVRPNVQAAFFQTMQVNIKYIKCIYLYT